MTERNEDAANITGPAPGGVGLLIIDMINSMTFEGAENIRPNAEASAEVILKLRREADELQTPVIYINDNYGHWHSDKSRLVDAFSSGDYPGQKMVRQSLRATMITLSSSRRCPVSMPRTCPCYCPN